MKVWSKQFIFIKVPHVKSTFFEHCCLSRDVQLCCWAHLNINDKYGKDTFPCGLWDLPNATPTAVGVTADLLNFVVFHMKHLPCALCKSSWPELRAKNQKVWKWLKCRVGKMGCAIRHSWAEETDVRRKKAWAAIRRRLLVAGVNLSINGQLIRHIGSRKYVCPLILKYSVEKSLSHEVKDNIQWSKICNRKGEQSLGRTDRKEI